MNNTDKIYVAGHQGMVGSAIVRQLEHAGFNQIIGKTRAELDLCDQQQVFAFFEEHQPDYVFLAAAKVGGIHANNEYPAEFIYQNLMMEANIIHSAYQHSCQGLLFLGSSCIYPKLAEQPIQENSLLTGVLEATNEPYAIAKIAGIKLCESYQRQYGCDFRSVMPTNLYGPNDNFHPENSHVIPALMRRIHQAKLDNAESVTIWGSGKPMREFLHVDDMAAACIHVMSLSTADYLAQVDPRMSHINVGTGIDVTIRELAETLCEVIGFQGQLSFDNSKPDGTPRKLLDVSKLSKLGWQARMDLKSGLNGTYQWFLENTESLRS